MNLQTSASRPSPSLPALNPRQQEVVDHGDGPLLVLAGAGTGKTSALTARLANLLRSRGVPPWKALAVTFTNKAAREMRERVALRLAGADIDRPDWVGTFHAFGGRLLRRHAELAGLRPDFAILDRADSMRMLQQVHKDFGLDPRMFPPAATAGWIDQCKNQAKAPETLSEADGRHVANGRGLEAYREYRKRCQGANAADFGDLILLPVRLLQAHPEVAERYRNQFEHVLVDEYQDVNVAQYLLLRLVAESDGNICCAGDDDQAIYGWRGAEVGHILRFQRDFPTGEIIRLEQNYRSTRHILAVGSSLMADSRQRLGKTLWSDLGEGQRVRVIRHADGGMEAAWIADEIERLTSRARGKPISPAEVAVLVRAGYQLQQLEELFVKAGLPYRVVGATKFFDRAEIRDAIAYFQLAARDHAHLAFLRVANTPRRRLGPASLDIVAALGREGNLGVEEALQAAVDRRLLRPAPAAALGELATLIQGWKAACAERPPVAELGRRILAESGYLDMLRREDTRESGARIENLEELLSVMADFDDLPGFLEQAALQAAGSDREDGEEKVSLMTIHAAKGLEFDAVFLPGWEDETFPSPRAVEDVARNGLDEERRIAHVAVTRARRLLTISHAARRRRFGRHEYRTPSRFLSSLPAACVDWLDDGGETEIPFVSRLETAALRTTQYRSPGWSRLQQNRALANDGLPRRPRPAGTRRFANGQQVFHGKFGQGEVLSSDHRGVQVRFPTGERTVVASFLSAARDRE